MGLITELIQRNEWEDLYESLSSQQRRLLAELWMTDRLGRTPLHYACAKKQAPEVVIALMLHHCGTKWYSSRDICGNTPLHAAAANGNAHVVRILLRHLHYSSRLQYVNDVGSTPLLMAWKKYLDPSSTLFGHVHSVGRPSPEGTRNIHLLTSVHDVFELQENDDYVALQDVWSKTACLVSQDNKPMTRPLHELAAVGGKRHVQCPTVAYWLAIRLYSHHLHLNDELGNLPIHLAAIHPNLAVLPMIFDASTEQDLSNVTESALTQLAKTYAKGAVTLNRHLRLPIQLAILSGKDFHEGIHALVQAAPHTLEQRDVHTKLPPFLLAATCPKAPLTVVWELIRARPDLISSMANSNNKVQACKRWANEIQDEQPSAKRLKCSVTP